MFKYIFVTESVCEDTFEHGVITGTCTKTIGEVCQYNCDAGYVNTTGMTVCKSDKKWHPRNPCTSLYIINILFWHKCK
jgi:hypothetical protein